MILVHIVRYDFTKVQEQIDLSDKTLTQISEAVKLHYVSLMRVLRTGRAHKSTAGRLVNYFGLTMQDIAIKKRSRRVA